MNNKYYNCKTSPNNKITVSIVIPVYNVASYIERCVQSVIQQTLPAKECIIVDDASNDDSIMHCKQIIEKYEGPTRFIILHHDQNRGLSAARNTGTYHASADYIYYLDGDDRMAVNCLEKLATPLVLDETIEMVMGDFRIDYTSMTGLRYRLRQLLGIRQPHFMQDTPLELQSNDEVRKWFYHGKKRKPVNVWNKLLNLSFVKNYQLYNKEGLIYEDGLWNMLLLRCLHHTVFVHDVTYFHNIRPESIITGQKYEDELRYHGHLFKEIADRVEPSLWTEEIKYVLWEFCSYFIDDSNDNNYKYAYNIFRRELYNNHAASSYRLLTLTHRLSKNWISRQLFRLYLRFKLYFSRIIIFLKK